MVQGLYGGILNSYGNPWLICPSPMLSCLLEGCVDSGADMTNGGSRYMQLHKSNENVSIIIVIIIVHRFHTLTPMYAGFANTVNSLYNVKKMVYDENNVSTLEMLRMALINNWGEK